MVLWGQERVEILKCRNNSTFLVTDGENGRAIPRFPVVLVEMRDDPLLEEGKRILWPLQESFLNS